MNNTMRVLQIMADGKPRSSKQLRAETGFTLVQVESVIRNIVHRGMATVTPVTYQINEHGVERSQFVPLPASAKRNIVNAKKREARAKAKAEEERSAAMESMPCIISSAKASRSPLEQAWGVFHA